MFGTNEEAAFGFVGIAVGTLLRDLLMRWSSRGDRANSDAQRLRDEIRKDNEELRCEVRRLTAEVNLWRGQFYRALDALIREDRQALKELVAMGTETEVC